MHKFALPSPSRRSGISDSVRRPAPSNRVGQRSAGSLGHWRANVHRGYDSRIWGCCAGSGHESSSSAVHCYFHYTKRQRGDPSSDPCLGAGLLPPPVQGPGGPAPVDTGAPPTPGAGPAGVAGRGRSARTHQAGLECWSWGRRGRPARPARRRRQRRRAAVLWQRRAGGACNDPGKGAGRITQSGSVVCYFKSGRVLGLVM
mmetsp:Transcript_92046/g.210753  ORF Transcript_92046/g.210753 Transcript_92046/m.210753 type:complete len:201 (-) Transcript_92046:9-611(-)